MIKSELNEVNLNSHSINIDLQLNLLNTWAKFKVADYYQNIFLAHLDELKRHEAEQHIKKEIKQTLERRSPYFQLEICNQERKIVLTKLQQKVQASIQGTNLGELSTMCSLLRQVRQANLITAEQILKMQNTFHCKSPQGTDKQLEYYDTILNQLDQDVQFLKTSVLSNYIQFDDGYDPFFMAQYQHTHRNKNHNICQPIKEFYSLNISYAYRLMKTKNTILELKSLVNPHYKQKQSNYSLLPSNRSLQNQNRFTNNRQFRKPQLIGKIESNPNSHRITLRDSSPRKISPIQIYPSPQIKQKTGIYNEELLGQSSSSTEVKLPPKLKFSKINQPNDSRTSSFHHEPSTHQYYRRKATQRDQYEPKQEPMITDFNIFPRKKSIYFKVEQSRVEQQKPNKFRSGVGEIYRSVKLTPLKHRRHYTEQTSFVNNKKNQESSQKINPNESEQQKTQKLDYNPTFKQVKHYNPITREGYSIHDTLVNSKKYDFNPIIESENIKIKEKVTKVNTQPSVNDKDSGLVYEQPISKYNTKSKRNPKKSVVNVKEDIKEDANKMDQQCQTMELQKIETNGIKKALSPSVPLQNRKRFQHKQQSESDDELHKKSEKPSQKKVSPQPSKKVAQKEKSQQEGYVTLQQEDIIDQRPKRPSFQKPLIRTLIDKPQKKHMPASPTQPQQKQLLNPINSSLKVSEKDNSQIKIQSLVNSGSGVKRQILMKFGELSLEQILSLLQNSKINDKYKVSFEIDKLIPWIKVNQTYLIQIHINNQLSIIALCSPIPNIGIAIKLWAPISPNLDDNVTSHLFKKYIEFIQRSTTTQKIMFSGKKFQQLDAADFVLKRQNLYERIRKNPPKQISKQFKSFLYVECSNIRFEAKGNQKLLYSQQIEEFTVENSYTNPLIGEVMISKASSQLKSLIKYDENVQNFKAVNEILTKQQFDLYQANQLNVSNINLIRFYLNASLKSLFIAHQGFLKFQGTLIHNKGQECIVGVSLSKKNGNIYFCKNIQWPSILQLIKKPSTTRISFAVMMFNKKLYGKIPNSPAGCYGNWQINLTWQDEMQGKIKHNIKEAKCFGPQKFTVMIEVQKQILYGFEVGKGDSIF